MNAAQLENLYQAIAARTDFAHGIPDLKSEIVNKPVKAMDEALRCSLE